MTDDDVYSEEESDDDAFFDELPDDALFTSVWLLTGITGSVFGHLTFANGRIAFTTNDGCVFNSPTAQFTVYASKQASDCSLYSSLATFF